MKNIKTHYIISIKLSLNVFTNGCILFFNIDLIDYNTTIDF